MTTGVSSKAAVLAKFRIFPEPGCQPHWHYDVFLFSSKQKMYSHMKSTFGNGMRDYIGLCIPSNLNDSWYKRNKLGELHFPIEHFTGEIIAHECTHAALAWFRNVEGIDGPATELSGEHRKGLCDDEEFVADVVGSLVRQVSEKTANINRN